MSIVSHQFFPSFSHFIDFFAEEAFIFWDHEWIEPNDESEIPIRYSLNRLYSEQQHGEILWSHAWSHILDVFCLQLSLNGLFVVYRSLSCEFDQALEVYSRLQPFDPTKYRALPWYHEYSVSEWMFLIGETLQTTFCLRFWFDAEMTSSKISDIQNRRSKFRGFRLYGTQCFGFWMYYGINSFQISLLSNFQVFVSSF